jgi:hypothetical protein
MEKLNNKGTGMGIITASKWFLRTTKTRRPLIHLCNEGLKAIFAEEYSLFLAHCIN